MNRSSAAWILRIFFLLFCSRAIAQPVDSPAYATIIKPFEISVGYERTTNLIFPYEIKSVDRGSGAVIAQKAKGAENILQVKAGRKEFAPTNLSVVTAEGGFYSFLLNYSPEPSKLNISFSRKGFVPLIRIAGKRTAEQQLERDACKVLSQSRFMRIRSKQALMQLGLQGVFLADHSMWFKLRARNSSQIDFQPAYLRFFLRDKRKTKRTAQQETEIFPVYTSTLLAVKGMDGDTWLIAFEPFTLPRNQRLVIQTGEQNGGRSLTLIVKNKMVLKARKL